jgi:hypothetical protein
MTTLDLIGSSAKFRALLNNVELFFGAREKLPTPAFQNWPRHSDLNPFHEPMRGDLKHHHARGPEETVCDLPAVVPAGRASREPPTCLRESGMPDVAAAEDPSRLAPPEPRLRHRLANRPTRGADTIPTGTLARACPIEPTTLGVRERPVRTPRR